MPVTTYHDPLWVAVSILIAVAASYTALSLGRRVHNPVRWIGRAWLAAAALSLGGGIWSMHFVAMLALKIPGMQMAYDTRQTLLSLVIAVIFTAAGFAIGASQPYTKWKTAGAGLLMGGGVLAMHYLGMAAMRGPTEISFDPSWVGVSVVIAVSASTIAAYLAFQDRQTSIIPFAAVAMGVAISGMHYAGMQAAAFRPMMPSLAPHTDSSFESAELAIAVTIVTIGVLLIALGAARVERFFHGVARREARIVLRLRLADMLRDSDTDRALNEVAKLMGEHFGVVRTGYAMLDPGEDVFDYEVCWTDGTVPPLLGRFPAAAFGAKIVAELSAGRTVAISDLRKNSLSDEPRTQETAREVDTRAILVVPFVREGRLRSIVYLNDREPRSWHPQDVAFMEELAERTRLVLERAAVEEQLRQLNATLEQRVELRTQELREAQDALLQSQKMEAVGQLVAGLAHDFNNVLGAVVGAFTLIKRRTGDPDKVLELAEAGAQAAERGTALTSQLMAFSRSHKMQLEPFFVCDVIQRMNDLLARTLGPMINLTLNLNPRPRPVVGNPNQFEMMVLNLAINARDAMPVGGNLVIATSVKSIVSEPDIDPGEYVEIAVSDTGFGMDEDTRRRAMEPFFTTKPVGKGTGLGLAQIYGSARQAGGTVRIESELGRGTSVKILLPCSSALPALDRPREEAPLSAPAIARKLKIVLVDDDEHVLFITAQTLRDFGHTVETFPDGQAALDCLASSRPDLMITDFAMPRINGAQLAAKALALHADLPVIFMSGYADTDAIQSSVGERALIVAKPCSLESLISAIDSALQLTVAEFLPGEL